MAKNNLSRYLWIIDTIRRYGHITREELSDLWSRSSLSGGHPMPRRTFYNDRIAIADIFGIDIEHNSSTYEYYIDDTDSHQATAVEWMLNSASVGDVLNDMRELGQKVFFEDVPSAREHLRVIVEALKQQRPISFTYRPYTRVNPTTDNRLEPYFLKIFKQRWYVTGRNRRTGTLRTYALDRMSDVTQSTETFRIPEDFDAEEYISGSYGIIFDEGEVKNVSIRVDRHQAKYFRSVPLHHSQSEALHDTYSIFTYRIRLTPDFVQELLSHGPSVTVLNPPELRSMMISSLRESLERYGELPKQTVDKAD